MENNQTLATELLHEVKAQSRRWFIAFIVVLGLWFTTIAGFIWYISLPIDETNIEQEASGDSYNQVVGGDYNGEAENN